MENKIKIVVYDETVYQLPEGIDKFMKFWQSKINLIPSEFINTSIISIDATEEYGDFCFDIEIYYWRTETRSETNMREREVLADKMRSEQTELEQLKKLKEKYPES